MSRGYGVAAVVLTLLTAACSESPVAPQTKSPTITSAAAPTTLARYVSDAPPVAAFASKTIGPEGGTLSLAGFAVVVPAGAVSKPTNFTIRLPGDARLAEYVSASFGPDAVRFARPLTLKLPYAGTTSAGGTAHVVWFDGSSWVALPTTTDTNDGSIQTQTTQLTNYGTEETEPAKGIEPVGG